MVAEVLTYNVEGARSRRCADRTEYITSISKAIFGLMFAALSSLDLGVMPVS